MAITNRVRQQAVVAAASRMGNTWQSTSPAEAGRGAAPLPVHVAAPRRAVVEPVVGGSIGVAFLNWRKLTDRHGQFRRAPLFDALSAASDVGTDILLSAELGAASHTIDPDTAGFDVDWEPSPGNVVGQGVGAFFASIWEGRWAASRAQLCNCRFYLVRADAACVAAGVVHAPHTGYPVQVREDFYRSLWKEWTAFIMRHPGAWRVLAGDANLPGLFTPEGRAVAKAKAGRVEAFVLDTFCSSLQLANCAGGTSASPNHDGGNVLSVLFTDPAIELLNFKVHEPGIAGSDHWLISAALKCEGWHRPQPPLRWRPNLSSDWHALTRELGGAWRAWLQWFRDSVRAELQQHTDECRRIRLVNEAVAMLGALTLLRPLGLGPRTGDSDVDMTNKCLVGRGARNALQHFNSYVCTGAPGTRKRHDVVLGQRSRHSQ